MAQVKVSALSSLLTLDNSDLILITEDVGAGNYNSKKMLFSIFKTQLGIGNSLNYVPKWNGSIYVDSLFFDNGTNVGLNVVSPTAKLHVKGDDSIGGTFVFKLENSALSPVLSARSDGALCINGNSYGGRLTIIDNNSTFVGLHIINSSGTPGTAINLDSSATGNVNSNIAWSENGVTKWAIRHSASGAPTPDNFAIRNSTIGFNEVNALLDITMLGFFGFGINAPTAKIHVKSSGSTSATRALTIENSSSTSLMQLQDGGNLGIGVSSPLYRLDVNGTINMAEGGILRVATNKFLHYTHATLDSAGSGNTYLGYNIGLSTAGSGSTGIGNTGVGTTSLDVLTTGTYNTVVGSFSGRAIVSGSSNSLFGAGTGQIVTGTGNTGLGNGSLFSVSSGSYNVGVGVETFVSGGASITGTYNIAIGYSAGIFLNGNSSNNIHIGSNSGNTSSATRNNTIIIGVGSVTEVATCTVLAHSARATASNTLYLGSSTEVTRYDSIVLGTDDYNSVLSTTTQKTIELRAGTTNYNNLVDMGGNTLRIGSGKATGNGSAGAGFGNLHLATTSIGATGTAVRPLVDRITIEGNTGNIGFWATSFGSGSGVACVGNAVTAPTTNPTNAIINYSEGAVWKYRDGAGNIITI